jgi:hypothetical protein
MAATSDKSTQSLALLNTTVESTSDLITQLLSSFPTLEPTNLNATNSDTKEKDTHDTNDRERNAVDALQLSRDSASLIRAHSTKLSLLIISEPFTPSAITTVLRELVAGPLPGLASAVQLCDASKYTKAMSNELHWRAKNVFTELRTLVQAIPRDGKVLSTDQKNGTGDTAGKGSLSATGVVWEACDALSGLYDLGVAGLMIKKTEEFRDLVKDALEELQEWSEEHSDDEEDDGSATGADSDDGADMSAQNALDDMFGSQRHIPTDDPEKIRPRLESCNKRLRMIVLMYQAVTKRRLKTLPTLPHPQLPAELAAKSNEDPGIANCLDELLGVLKKITDVTDELASAFYDLDSEEIDKRMDQCFFTAFAAVELLIKNWEGEQDEFTVWVFI